MHLFCYHITLFSFKNGVADIAINMFIRSYTITQEKTVKPNKIRVLWLNRYKRGSHHQKKHSRHFTGSILELSKRRRLSRVTIQPNTLSDTLIGCK
jgi:hypothetical protein